MAALGDAGKVAFPEVPIDVLRACAARLVPHYTDVISLGGIEAAGVHAQPGLDVMQFLAGAYDRRPDEILKRLARSRRH